MSRIDYSKWDKMDFSDSDEECSSSNKPPNVTRLDEPSRVTCSPSGIKIEAKEVSPMVASSRRSGENNEDVDAKTKNGGIFTDPATDKVTAFWSQDRYEVILWIAYDHGSINSSDIRISTSGILSYDERNTTRGGFDSSTSSSDEMNGSKGQIKVTAIGFDAPIFKGNLAYPCHLALDEDEIDWEIVVVSGDSKMIRMTLLKAVPIEGLTIWWSRPFLHFPTIDVVKDIEGRNATSGDDNQNTKQDQWKESWDEAHRLFREKVKQREKQII